MNTLLLTFLALLAITSAANVPKQLLSKDHNTEGEISKNEISGRGIIVNAEWRKVVKDFLKQFENGLKIDQILLNKNNSNFDIDAKIENLCVMDLDDMDIQKLDVDYVLLNTVRFKFLWPKVNISGKVFTNSFNDMLRKFRLKPTGDIEADVELILKNVTFEGRYKYKMPVLFGNIKIYNFNGSLTLDNVVSRIRGLSTNGIINKLLNKAVEELILKEVKSNQATISSMLAKDLVPIVNSRLAGINIGTIIG